MHISNKIKNKTTLHLTVADLFVFILICVNLRVCRAHSEQTVAHRADSD